MRTAKLLKSEWHQAKVVRTRTQVVQGGAEVVQHHGGGGRHVGVQGVGVVGVSIKMAK